MSIPIDLDPIKRGLQMMSEVKAAHGSQSMRECINPDKVMESIALLIAEVERLRAEQRLDLADVDRFRAMARGYMDERDDARLAHPLNEGGKVAEASIVVDSVRLPDHRPRLHDLWRYAQEAADAPVTAVVSLLRDMGANEAADEVLKGRKAATPLIAQAEEPGDDEWRATRSAS